MSKAESSDIHICCHRKQPDKQICWRSPGSFRFQLGISCRSAIILILTFSLSLFSLSFIWFVRNQSFQDDHRASLFESSSNLQLFSLFNATFTLTEGISHRRKVEVEKVKVTITLKWKVDRCPDSG